MGVVNLVLQVRKLEKLLQGGGSDPPMSKDTDGRKLSHCSEVYPESQRERKSPVWTQPPERDTTDVPLRRWMILENH